MDNMFVTKKQFKYFKERWKKWQDNDLKDCDPTIADIVTQMNNIKGVVTIYGCVGHHETKVKDTEEQFYVAMVATDSGFCNLVSVFSRLRHELSKSDNFDLPHKVGLKSELLLSDQDLPDAELCKKNGFNMSWYPVWIIEGFLTKEEKIEVLAALRRTLHIKWNDPLNINK